MPSEAFVLGFDTSAAHCAAAIICGDQVLAARVEEMGRGQAERLMPLLAEIMAEAKIEWRDLSLIGVGVGPGNFTGIRISVAAARGLALGLGIRAVGVTSFEALSDGLTENVIASVSAPQDRVYISVPKEGAAPVLCDLDSLPSVPAPSVKCIVGARAEEIAKHYSAHVVQPIWPLAVGIARQARGRQDIRLESPAPLYLRPADAAPASDPPPVILDA